ncbi:MAG: DUF6011 domain-containing protein [Acetobacter sp.]|nr:DUF6011 domain-containing protein [Acetobacter sp.]
MQQLKKGTEEQFVFAGNSVFTLESGTTGRRFTYRVKKAEDRNGLYFVSVLKGRDNDNDYAYVGILTKAGVKLTKASHHTKQSLCVKAIDFFMQHLANIPEALHIYHEGRCCCCGRRLTTPESITNGYGPECAKLHHFR